MARVLIVEDEGLIAMQIEEELAKMGHESVGIVGDGALAVDMAEKENPDIVLMDIVLRGDLNGIETSRRLCEISECRIIYITANADEATIEEAKQSRHVGFLHKPFEPRMLSMAIDRAMGL